MLATESAAQGAYDVRPAMVGGVDHATLPTESRFYDRDAGARSFRRRRVVRRATPVRPDAIALRGADLDSAHDAVRIAIPQPQLGRHTVPDPVSLAATTDRRDARVGSGDRHVQDGSECPGAVGKTRGQGLSALSHRARQAALRGREGVPHLETGSRRGQAPGPGGAPRESGVEQLTEVDRGRSLPDQASLGDRP